MVLPRALLPLTPFSHLQAWPACNVCQIMRFAGGLGLMAAVSAADAAMPPEGLPEVTGRVARLRESKRINWNSRTEEEIQR